MYGGRGDIQRGQQVQCAFRAWGAGAEECQNQAQILVQPRALAAQHFDRCHIARLTDKHTFAFIILD
jgi:hypothetical protein